MKLFIMISMVILIICNCSKNVENKYNSKQSMGTQVGILHDDNNSIQKEIDKQEKVETEISEKKHF